MDSQKFGTFIAQCRKDKKMTQSDLAAKLNVTDKAISRWESSGSCGTAPGTGSRQEEAPETAQNLSGGRVHLWQGVTH